MKGPSVLFAMLFAPMLATASIGPSTFKLDQPSTPIEGAFGYKLGDVFTPDASAVEVTSSLITEKALPGALYRVTPRADLRVPPFQSYFILCTLKTHQIAAIYAAASPDCLSEDGAAQKLSRQLAQEYGKSATLPLQIHEGARQIVLQCTSQVLKLVYADVDLAYTYAREAAEIEASEKP